jgi:hypothetical protein
MVLGRFSLQRNINFLTGARLCGTSLTVVKVPRCYQYRQRRKGSLTWKDASQTGVFIDCSWAGSLPVVERVMTIRGNGRGAMEVPCTWIPTPGD